ncbi:MAG: peptidoglycan recognition family protein, partial [Planctomycetota bacterium]|nr:peptidoglycan recognition family protein [Planctomycetota bacterium]
MTDVPHHLKPDETRRMNLGRMAAVWLTLLAAMGTVGLVCWAAMPKRDRETSGPEEPQDASLESVIRPDGMALPREWKYIIIHHSATRSATLEAIDRWHRETLHTTDSGYHFVINNGRAEGTRDGEITPTPRWLEQRTGAHCRVAEHPEFNEQGIGICLVGHFNREQPTAAQMASLEALVAALSARYHIPLERV